MFNLARLKEALGDSRATYASKAMQWIGERLILSARAFGMPDDFWWDQEDRDVLKGGETGDPRYQRLQTRTDDFRRYLTYGVGRFMPVVVPLLAVPLLLGGYLAVVVLGPGSMRSYGQRVGVEAIEQSNEAPADMNDSELVQAISQMNAAGKTEQTINGEERAIVAEARRRRLMN